MATNNPINSPALAGVSTAATNSQVLVGGTGVAPIFTSIVSNTLSVPPISQSLTMNVIRLASGGGGWNTNPSGTLLVNSAYLVTTVLSAATLPAVTTQGDIIYVFCQSPGTMTLTIPSGGSVYGNNAAALTSTVTLAVNSSVTLVATTTGSSNPVYSLLAANGLVSGT